jgi:NAD-dependent histone deacetylase SIR2
LNLFGEHVHHLEEDQLARLKKVLHQRRKIVVVAGAGISVSAGSKSHASRVSADGLVPDFRSGHGLFKSLKKEHKLKSSGKDLFDASTAYKDEASITSFHQMVRTMSKMTKSAEPTPFHHMLASLADEGRLLRLYTQNVDGIDTAMAPLNTNVPLNRKGPWPKSVQLHGGLQKMVCSKCHEMSELDADLFDGPVPPTCHMCEAADNARTEHAGKRSHGIGRLRPRMVLYNEHNPDDEAIGRVVAADLRTRPDALIVVGTTLKIPGVKRIVKEMCNVVRGRRDGATVWINTEGPPPGKDYEWDLIVRGPCDRVAEHADMPHWDGPRPIPVAPGDQGGKSPCVLIPATPKKEAASPKTLPTPRSLPASRRATPAKDAAGKPAKKQVSLKLNFGANPKPEPKRRGRPPKQSAGVKKTTKPKKGTVPNGRISFTASKAGTLTAAAEGKKLGMVTKSVQDEPTAATVEALIQPRSPKPMLPVSPADLNAVATIIAGKEDGAEVRRGFSVMELLNVEQ